MRSSVVTFPYTCIQSNVSHCDNFFIENIWHRPPSLNCLKTYISEYTQRGLHMSAPSVRTHKVEHDTVGAHTSSQLHLYSCS